MNQAVLIALIQALDLPHVLLHLTKDAQRTLLAMVDIFRARLAEQIESHVD